MAIGDTWETINTYAFVAGETIITADYENDVVNNLQYLYNRFNTKVNIWMSQTNTNVSLTQNTNDIALGWTITFTPTGSKVFMFLQFASVYSYISGVSTYHQAGYKVNSGSIVYIDQDTGTAGGAHQNDSGQLLIVPSITVNAGVSNTITFYAKTGATGGTYNFWHGRVVVIEQAN